MTIALGPELESALKKLAETEALEDGALPERHRRELERRIIAADTDPEAGIPWEVVKIRLAGRPRARPS